MDPQRFSVYGLTVETNILLPGVPLAIDGEQVDVRLCVREAVRSSAPRLDERAVYTSLEYDAPDTPRLVVWKGDGYRFVYGEGAEFQVDPLGTIVKGLWLPPLVEADAASFVLGPILAFVLRLRGVVPLHASAVAVDGRALVFAGPAGAGKSTTAAALGVLGYQVLSDDVVPLAIDQGRVFARPGFPRVSVWEDSAKALLGDASEALAPWSDAYTKRCIDAGHARFQFASQPLEVSEIYLLHDRQGTVRSEPLGSRDQLIALSANTYGSYLLDGPMRAHEFAFLTRVVRHVSVRSLWLADDLTRLTAVCGELLSAR